MGACLALSKDALRAANGELQRAGCTESQRFSAQYVICLRTGRVLAYTSQVYYQNIYVRVQY